MIELSPEVGCALADGRPVVALESTLVSHGLPWPANVETALAMQAAVRDRGATPATIGIIAGRPTVGLSDAQLELLARGQGVTKASRRDLPVLVAHRGHAGTTVAATLAIMRLAGPAAGPGRALAVFATGGIGGVHRGAEHTFDISADLAELARARALVVCSGAKAILDLPRTVELLETLGVTILGYQTDELPAFYTSNSGLPITARVDDAAEAAFVARARWSLDLDGAVLLAVPPPSEAALAAEEAAAEIAVALARADQAGVRGSDLTPYLLDQVAELTSGRGLAANRALLVNNARVAADAARALADPEPTP